jgi:hypothetical protein
MMEDLSLADPSEDSTPKSITKATLEGSALQSPSPTALNSW